MNELILGLMWVLSLTAILEVLCLYEWAGYYYEIAESTGGSK